MTTIERNKEHYDRLYQSVDVSALVHPIEHLDQFLSDATQTDTSWYGLYWGGLRHRLSGSRVLELGAGNGLDALAMAALGADVTAIDISDETPKLVNAAARQLGLANRVRSASGDFLTMDFLEPRSFDFIVGKAFLHHLPHSIEAAALSRTAALLHPDGQARFLEPAVNSRVLDALRWLIPVPGRPSSLNRAAFRAWKDADPHPPRDNSSGHYRSAAAPLFADVEIVCIGAIERFHRVLPRGAFNRSFRRLAFRLERRLPASFNFACARSQLIICRQPLH